MVMQKIHTLEKEFLLAVAVVKKFLTSRNIKMIIQLPNNRKQRNRKQINQYHRIKVKINFHMFNQKYDIIYILVFVQIFIEIFIFQLLKLSNIIKMQKQNKLTFQASQTSLASIQSLKNLAYDKQKYFNKKRQKKYEIKSKIAAKSYNSYLNMHKQMPKVLFSTQKIVQIIQSVYQKPLNNVFKILKLKASEQLLKQQNNKIIQSNKNQQINKNYHIQNFRKYKLLFQNLSLIYKKQIKPTILSCFNLLKLKTHKKSNILKPQSESIIYTLSEAEKTNKSIQKLRLCQIDTHNKITNNKIDQNKQDFLYSSYLQSNQSHSTILSNLQQDYFSLQKLLFEKIDCLNLKYDKSVNKYQETISFIKEKILMQKQVNFFRPQILQGHSKISDEGFFNQVSINSDHVNLICDTSYNQMNMQNQAFASLSQRYQQLNDEADNIETIVQQVLTISALESNINPDLIILLSQIKQILRPSPLGMSLLVTQ